MFSFDKRGAVRPIAKIVSDDELDGKLLYLHRKHNGIIPEGYFDEITLERGIFEYFPEIRDKFTDVILCAGSKGSGKSTYIAKMAEAVKDIYELNDEDSVVIKNSKIVDEAFDNLNPDYIYTDEFADNDFTIDDFTNSDGTPKIMIFDDIDIIPKQSIKKKVYDLMDTIAVEGRKHKIFQFVVRHSICKGKDTKLIGSECDFVLLFTEGFTSDINYYMEKYCDFSKELRRDIRKTNSRWILLSKISPRFILTERRCFIFDIDREEERLKKQKEIKKINDRKIINDIDDNNEDEEIEYVQPKRLLKKKI